MLFDVEIQAIIRKTIRVNAVNEDMAIEIAHENFTVDNDGDEHYEQDTMYVEKVE